MTRKFQKNDIVQIRIEDVGNGGEGIGKADGYTVFVKNAVPGDLVEARIIKAKKNYGYGRIEEIKEPSKDRTQPKCPLAQKCGGCQLQFLSYPAQLEYKQNKVKNDLIRIGGFDKEMIEELTEPIIGMENPLRYRNKAQFPVGLDEVTGKLSAGFYAPHSHRIIPCRDCLLGIEQNRDVLDVILEWMRENHVSAYDEKTGKGIVRHILIRYGFQSKEMLICLVINKKKLPAADKLISKLTENDTLKRYLKGITCSINTKNTNVILGDNMHVLWGNGYILDEIGGIRFRISPLSFYQVNPVQTEKLYGKVLEYAGLTGNETVWDLYCGIGTISLFLAKEAKKVYGVEIIPAAVEDAKRNATLNGFENTEFFVGKAEDAAGKLYEDPEAKADVVVVDPPRKGCDQALLNTILKMAPERIVYVSCDPATLARDLKILCGKDYQLRKVQAIEQFSMTIHVESCVLLERVSSRKADSYVKLNKKMEDYYRIKDSADAGKCGGVTENE